MTAQRSTDPRRATRPTRTLAAVTAVLAVMAGCASDDGTSADDPVSTDAAAAGEDFCESLRTAMADDTMQLDGDDGLEAVRTLAAAAPAELEDTFAVYLDVAERLSALDENDPELFEKTFAIAFEPEVVRAGERLERFAVDDCGIDPAEFDQGPDEGFSDDGFDDSPFDEPEIDPNVISLDGVDAFLDERYGDTTWRRAVTGYTLLGGQLLAVSGSTLESDALAICAAVLEYSSAIDPAVRVEVTDDSGAVVHATTGDDGTCTAP